MNVFPVAMRSSFFATAALLFVGLVSSARAQTQAIPYQGKLFQDGRPANGSYDLRYSLFNSATLATPVATLDQPAQGVTNGFFSTALDFGPVGVVWDGRDYWLEVLVRTNTSTAGFESLGGRRALLPVPYALFAGKAGELVGMVGNAKLASGIDAGKITTGDLAAARLSVGTGHTLTGVGASIAGGQQNTVSGDYSFLGGGFGNINSGQGSFLGGGSVNTVSGVLSFLGGGDRNTISGPYSFLGGGQLNTSSGNHSFLGAGALNTASGNESFLGGGSDNTASGGYSFLGGGYGNTNSGDYSFLGGGTNNTASGEGSFLGGGYGNTNSGLLSFLGGGIGNTASGLRSMVLGGFQNKAQGMASFAAGTRAEALHNGAFVWADSTNAAFPSTVANEFAVRATGGFRLVAAVDGDGVPTQVLTYDASGLRINGKITTGDLAATRLSVGTGHTLTGVGASIAGGRQNTASGVLSFLGGGIRNTSSGNGSFLGNGIENTASGQSSFLGGGERNTNSGYSAFLGGGSGNTNSGDFSFLGGGLGNTASGNSSFLGGGDLNTASGLRSMVLGGERNKAQGIASLAAGTRAEALADGAFVWADSTPPVFPSTVANEFAVRATGGFRLVAAVDGDGVPTQVLTYDASGLFINGVPVAMQGLIPTSTGIPRAHVTSPKLLASGGASGTIADGSVTAEARIQTLEKQNASLEARVAALEALVKSAAQK